MNLHRKILEIGFKKTKYHQREMKSDGTFRYEMVPKDSIVLKTYNKTLRKTVTQQKPAPKWTSFYLFEFNSDIKIWIEVEKHNAMIIFLESSRIKNGVDIIYSSYDSKKVRIESKKDIISLLPTEIQREFIINSILN